MTAQGEAFIRFDESTMPSLPLLQPSPSPPSQPLAARGNAFDARGNAFAVESDPVASAKLFLVVWRDRQPLFHIGTKLYDAMRSLRKRQPGTVLLEPDLDRSERQVLERVRTVLEGDRWKGSPCGKHWVTTWLKWEAPFGVEDVRACTDAIGGKNDKKRQHFWRWYFGSLPYMQPIGAVRMRLVDESSSGFWLAE